MNDIFVEFRPTTKAKSAPILQAEKAFKQFGNFLQASEVVIQHQLIQLYRCELTDLSCAIVNHNDIFFYDTSQDMMEHLQYHCNLPKGVNILEIRQQK